MKSVLAIDLLREFVNALEDKALIVSGMSLEYLQPKDFYGLEDAFSSFINYYEQKDSALMKRTLEIIVDETARSYDIPTEKVLPVLKSVVDKVVDNVR